MVRGLSCALSAVVQRKRRLVSATCRIQKPDTPRADHAGRLGRGVTSRSGRERGRVARSGSARGRLSLRFHECDIQPSWTYPRKHERICRVQNLDVPRAGRCTAGRRTAGRRGGAGRGGAGWGGSGRWRVCSPRKQPSLLPSKTTVLYDSSDTRTNEFLPVESKTRIHHGRVAAAQRTAKLRARRRGAGRNVDGSVHPDDNHACLSL